MSAGHASFQNDRGRWVTCRLEPASRSRPFAVPHTNHVHVGLWALQIQDFVTSGVSGHKLWTEWNPERVSKTPSQNTIIVKPYPKKQLLCREVKVLLWNFLPHATEKYKLSFSSMKSAIFMWSHDSKKWSFIQNSRNVKSGYIRDGSNMCPGSAIPAACW